jgi:hypothetical protein
MLLEQGDGSIFRAVVDDDDLDLDAGNRLRAHLAQKLDDARLLVEGGDDHAQAHHGRGF